MNAAIGSYGTVRELRILNRVDTQKLKYLIVHYSDNDVDENEAFFKNGNNLPMLFEREYRQLIGEYQKRKKYYFGKYTRKAIEEILFKVKAYFFHPHDSSVSGDDQRDEAGLFLNALRYASRVDLKNVTVIVVGSRDFAQLLKERIRSTDYPTFLKNMIIIEDNLDPQKNYYWIDEHMNASGHGELAKTILKFLI